MEKLDIGPLDEAQLDQAALEFGGGQAAVGRREAKRGDPSAKAHTGRAQCYGW